MTKLLQVGHSLSTEINDTYGHIACTLGTTNYESRGSLGVRSGRHARGASNPLFRKHYFILLSDAQGAAGKEFANSCVGQRYILGGAPKKGHGTDCSGFVAGIYLAAMGKPPKRLFTTATWRNVFDDLGFREGLHPSATSPFAKDRAFPGHVIRVGSPKSDDVRFIQFRLNAAKAAHPPLMGTGEFGQRTKAAVKQFQERHGLAVTGEVDQATWKALNAVL